jgi:subtilisin family serine protease
MNVARRLTIVGLGVVLCATVPVAGAGDFPDRATDAASSVTLLTGDRVLLVGSTPVIRPGPGREKMTFHGYRNGKHRYVVPADATRLVAGGQVDRRLFDVTELIESGYDDASRDTVPLIVTRSGPRTSLAGTSNARELRSINATAVSASKRGDLWTSISRSGIRDAGIGKVWLDGKRRALLDRSTQQIGAPVAWSAGLTGAGVRIAVLDTGVDQTHPDLATQEIAERNFTDEPDNVDHSGHGTHVASIAAGTGAKAGGTYRGVAFGASILDAKVLDGTGAGRDSWIIAGMEWAAEQGAKVANLSLGNEDTEGVDPLEAAVDALSAERGMLFVAAAGNSGIDVTTVDSPGSADAALSVGAVDRQDRLAVFSNRGPRLGDDAIKPDLTAPGTDIIAAGAAGGVIGTPVQDGYVKQGGTSQATAHVSGAAALLAQEHPDWTGQQLKAALSASATPGPGQTVFDQGSGRVDVARAIGQVIITEPTTASLGIVRWPHTDDAPVSTPVTYHNLGASDVTLNLTVEATGPDGQPAPSGVFAVSATRLVVPAGGSARVTVTADTRPATLTDGRYAGTIVATADRSAIRTPVAVNREVESYDLTVTPRDLDGTPTADYSVMIIGLDDDRARFPYDPDGVLTVRLPKGRYFLHDVVTTHRDGVAHTHLLPHPGTVLDRDTTVDVPASASRPVRVTTPDPTATLLLGDLGYDVTSAHTRSTVTFTTTDLSTVSIAQLGPTAPGVVITRVNTQWTTPGGQFYGLAWFQPGAVPTGFTKVVRRDDVATVHADLGTQIPGQVGQLVIAPNRVGDQVLAVGTFIDVPLPSVHTEFYNSDGVEWGAALVQEDPTTATPDATLSVANRVFRPGHTYRRPINHGPFAPAFPPSPQQPWAFRDGDLIDVFVPIFSDSAGNAGLTTVNSGSTKLFRDGRLVGESAVPGIGQFETQPEPGDFRLSIEASRPAAFGVTTRLSAEWTFRSGHTDVFEDPLPLPAIRLTPRLDNDNAAPAGRPFLIPVALQRQDSTLSRPRRLGVEVSYDEGTTWHPATVIANLAVLLNHPAHAASVSLRTTASDRDGSTVTETLIRAYRLKPAG